MLTKCAIIALSLFSLQAKAQFSVENPQDHETFKEPENTKGIVFYDFSHVSDTTKPDKAETEIMALSFSQDYGKFYSETFRLSDSAMMARIMKQMQEQPQATSGFAFTPEYQMDGTYEIFLSNVKDSSLAQKFPFMNKSYLVKDKNSLIDWTIEDSTKMIGSYTCQKAVGTSHGRHYTAWFTTDLPYSFGPRRLWGLPGLILEAYDDSKRIFYHFKSVNLAKHIPLGIPENAIYSTRKEYDDMQAAFSRDPMAFFKANMPASMSGAKVASVSSTFVGTSSKTSVVDFSPKKDKKTKKEEETKEEDNFPIDLTQD